MLWGESVVNRSQLGATARVGATQLNSIPDPARDPFHVHAHAFTAFVPARALKDERERAQLQSLLRQETPAHVRFELRAVEARMRIGRQSSIGLDAVVGRYPEGVELGQAALDRGQLLGPGPRESRRAIARVGERSQIGTTTVLG